MFSSLLFAAMLAQEPTWIDYANLNARQRTAEATEELAREQRNRPAPAPAPVTSPLAFELRQCMTQLEQERYASAKENGEVMAEMLADTVEAMRRVGIPKRKILQVLDIAKNMRAISRQP